MFVFVIPVIVPVMLPVILGVVMRPIMLEFIMLPFIMVPFIMLEGVARPIMLLVIMLPFMLPAIMLGVIMLEVVMRPIMLEFIIIGGRAIAMPILPLAFASGRKANMVRPAVIDQNSFFMKVVIVSLSLPSLSFEENLNPATLTLVAQRLIESI